MTRSPIELSAGQLKNLKQRVLTWARELDLIKIFDEAEAGHVDGW